MVHDSTFWVVKKELRRYNMYKNAKLNLEQDANLLVS